MILQVMEFLLVTESSILFGSGFHVFQCLSKLIYCWTAWVNNVFQWWMVGRHSWFSMFDLPFKVGKMLSFFREIDSLR